jgi:hypothetical protein
MGGPAFSVISTYSKQFFPPYQEESNEKQSADQTVTNKKIFS